MNKTKIIKCEFSKKNTVILEPNPSTTLFAYDKYVERNKRQ